MPKRNGILAALGLSVRRRREARALTQGQPTNVSSLDPAYINGIERGLRNPSIKYVARLTQALGLIKALTGPVRMWLQADSP